MPGGKDDFHSNQQGLAFTLRNEGAAVWDNNGIEDGSYATINKVCLGGSNFRNACTVDGDCPDSTCSSASFYEEAFGELVQPNCCTDPRSDNGQIGVGRNHAFGMSNFFDFIYATRVELVEETTIDEIIAYFDGDGPPSFPFNPDDPRLKYRINIWSASGNPLLPTYTASYVGDVMSTDTTPGTFSRSDTGVRRDFHSTTTSLINDPIFRLTWIPDTPIVLPAGIYYFNHDVRVRVLTSPTGSCEEKIFGNKFTRTYACDIKKDTSGIKAPVKNKCYTFEYDVSAGDFSYFTEKPRAAVMECSCEPTGFNTIVTDASKFFLCLGSAFNPFTTNNEPAGFRGKAVIRNGVRNIFGDFQMGRDVWKIRCRVNNKVCPQIIP